MFASTAVVALVAAVAAAQHAPVGEPSGNPITRPLNEVVAACEPFTIAWQPTTPNTVSLVLLRGPSSNVLPLQTLATGIANTGLFTWTPDAALEADVSHYGLQLIDDITGQYQYSTQFGISVGSECVDSASAISSAAYPASTPSSAAYPASTASPTPSSSSGAAANSSSALVVPSTTTRVVLSTGVPAGNSTVAPTRPLTVPSSLLPSATRSVSASSSSAPPESTGAAASVRAALGFVGAAAAFAWLV